MYKFESKQVDGQSLVHPINLLLGENLIGAEIGVLKAHTSCTLLQNCPNIKTLYLIDNYKPYSDFIRNPYNPNEPYHIVDQKEIELIKFIAHHNVKWSGHTDKALFIEEDSKIVAQHCQNASLDFVFLDTYMTQEQVISDLNDWYPKVKEKGLFSGHDWTGEVVQQAVLKFRSDNNIVSQLSIFDDTWMWIK
jgi:hypothetical protein